MPAKKAAPKKAAPAKKAAAPKKQPAAKKPRKPAVSTTVAAPVAPAAVPEAPSVPNDGLTPEQLLQRWDQLTKYIAATVKPLLEQERELRQRVFAEYFRTPKEGTNTLELGSGWQLKAKYDYDRKIDKAAAQAVFAKLPEGYQDVLVKWEPELVTSAYRQISDEHRAILEECLITKPKTVSLTLVPPPPSE